MRQLIILFFILGVSTSSFAQETLIGRITHNNIEREYILYVPANYTGNASVPLVFNFHGYRLSAGNQLSYGDFRPIADTEGFIVVHPQGTLFNGNTHWNVGAWTTGSTADDLGFTQAVLDKLTSEYNIDLTRVYSCGFSNGGFFSFQLACRLSHKFAAVASVGGSMSPLIYDNCNPTHPTPILQIHGTDDGVIPYNGIAWSWPIDNLLQYWTGYNNGSTSPTVINLPDINTNDGSTVKHFIYEGGDKGTTVEHFKVTGGMHTWPGTASAAAGTNQDINAAEEIWKFFSRYDINGLIETTSIEPIGAIKPNITIYPNPTISRIRIEGDIKEKVDLQLTSISGETLLRDSIHLNQYELDLSTFPEGVYILEIGSYQYKVVKN